ncbi:putative metal ion transporter C17A12.14 [Colletotrichum tanaceti]|uniref:Putative metal ion transporter C17A12.14 n=1 Tax=Colletotrichum tanaceti TaxID=1306861 RepID=A0A4U6XJ78_9PEZI|nr:putative metal ion transporter C17A12.14 [Colletotrichum tanaceti]KAJ0168838.1 putative metal ion transporter C17A12.14 [Colletotrichum tanaceti]TKW56040.1 putative metal ion transporter C17A12.14 [Colletotrichum tanaceti]
MSGSPFQPMAAHLQASTPQRPSMNLGSSSATPPPPATPSSNANRTDPNGQHQQPRRRKNHRGGAKKKRNRRKSFAVLPEESHDEAPDPAPEREDFYRQRTNLSNTSIESEALLDHREQQPLRPRRPSVMNASAPLTASTATPQTGSRLRNAYVGDSGEDDDGSWDEGAPLLSRSIQRSSTAPMFPSYGSSDPRQRASRRGSSRSSRTKLATPFQNDSYNVNYPPSMPGSPTFRPSDPLNLSFGDVMIHDDEIGIRASPRSSRRGSVSSHSERDGRNDSSPDLARRNTIALTAQEDVCFPSGISEIGDEEGHLQDPTAKQRPRRRRRRWPDLAILEEWSRFEKEGRSDERRVKRITEPQLINGRLRPITREWYRAEEDAPYRFTYFNEEFQSTIHSQTISELVQPGGNFQELFIPDPRVLSDDESEDSEEEAGLAPLSTHHSHTGLNGDSRAPTRQPSLANTQTESERRDGVKSPDKTSGGSSRAGSVHRTPTGVRSPVVGNQTTQTPELLVKTPRYGERPVWWLDVLSPTEAEMKVLSKAFGIHPLTAEDIMVQEAREKVELFRHYYFVNYRSFDQDQNSEDYLEPVNMYVIVFREGVISFHFSMTPHPANVRRRIRQLKDYLIVNSDWISYAIIDDITDVFVPLIQNIEDEVDDIDDEILRLHSPSGNTKNDVFDEKASNAGTSVGSEGDMLRRVGDCRKRVMSLYRLLGNKADVIKGFAKRCNERWEVAPRSDIGLYLGDIQDHIVTMTSNLSHYEKILARSHGNYLAQINIRMNERQEQTADVLGKLTVLGTIVLPMNIITGLWGMNVWVPGQEYEGDLKWFWAITAGLLAFGMGCYLIAKRVYNIV